MCTHMSGHIIPQWGHGVIGALSILHSLAQDKHRASGLCHEVNTLGCGPPPSMARGARRPQHHEGILHPSRI